MSSSLASAFGDGTGATLPIDIADVTGLQAELDDKAEAPIAFADLATLTASRVAGTNGSGVIEATSIVVADLSTLFTTVSGHTTTLSGIATWQGTTTQAEIGYVSGVTLAIQTQFNALNKLTTNGDTLYYNSGYQRLAKGTDGQVLTLASGIPSWAAPAGGGLTVGTTAIASGTVGRILFEGTGNVLQENPNITWDTTNSGLSLIGGSNTTHRISVGTSSIAVMAGLTSSTNQSAVKMTQSGALASATVAGYYVDQSSTSNSGAGVYALNRSNSAGLNAYFQRLSNQTTTPPNSIRMDSQSTGTPAAGFGIAVYTTLHSSTTVSQDAAKIIVAWRVATHASRSADILFHLVENAGAIGLTHTFSSGVVDINNSGGTYKVNGSTVVGARKTGWGLPTATLARATFDDTADITVIRQTLAALINDLHSGGGGNHALLTT